MTAIEWTDVTWNPVTGCDRVSPGCDHCYAERMANRLAGRAGYPADEPFRVTLHTDRLDQPLGWRKPRRVFVNSMSDMFHPDVPVDFIQRVWNTMAIAEQHTFQVLTKRPQRMREVLSRSDMPGYLHDGTPPPNVWVGTSVETERYANLRIPHLLATPAAVRFLSIEPLLGPISLRWPEWHDYWPNGWRERGEVQNEFDGLRRLDWVIVGGESGPGARPVHPDWVRVLRDHCVEAGVAFFFKQWGHFAPWVSDQRSGGFPYVELDDGTRMAVMGKKAAGRVLAGRIWDEYPCITTKGVA